MTAVQTAEMIAVDPYLRGGRAYIRGTTVTVSDVALMKLYHDQDTAGIAAWYGLTFPQVYTALAYYYEHKNAINREMRRHILRAQLFKEQRVGYSD